MIFITGNSRSGTTIMGLFLGNHERIFTFHEIHFFEQLVDEKNLQRKITLSDAIGLLANLIPIQRNGYLSKTDKNSYQSEAKNLLLNSRNINIHSLTNIKVYEEYLIYETGNQKKTIPCEQTPRNLFYTEAILKNYPLSKIVNMTRDSRSVLLSQKNKWKRRFLGAKNIPLKEALRSWANYHPIITSKLWDSALKQSENYKGHKSYKNVYFEKQINDPESTVKSICDFLEIDFRTKMLEVPHIGSPTGKDGSSIKGIRKDRIATWKNGLTSEEIFICQKITGKPLIKHGYKLKDVKVNYFRLVLLYATLPIKLTASFILNIGRYKNLVTSIKKRLT